MRDHSKLVFDVSADFYGWMTWQTTWRAHAGSLLGRVGALGEAPRILDLGIGPGISAAGVLDACPGALVVGVDLSPRMLKVARKKLARSGQLERVELVEADATRLPFEDGAFDAVVGQSFLYLLPDREAVVGEVARVLKPGGRCAFVEPRDGGALWPVLREASPLRFRLSMALWRVASRTAGRFTREGLEALLGGAMGDVEVTETLGGLGWIVSAERAD